MPTPPEVVSRMLALAAVGPNDYLIDLGSGDGRLVREAARAGAQAFGVEHDPELVARSRELARREGVHEKASFLQQDLFQTELSDATVVTMYLLPAVNLQLRPRLLAQLKPGSRIVSHDFDMDDWAPDATEKVYAKEKFGASGGESTIYLWLVPAQLAGRWTWELDMAGERLRYELTAAQRFQKVDAVLHINGVPRAVSDFRIRGEHVAFTVATEVKGSTVRQRFEGRAGGEVLQGSVVSSGPRLQGAADWSARRTHPTSFAVPQSFAAASVSSQARVAALPFRTQPLAALSRMRAVAP